MAHPSHNLGYTSKEHRARRRFRWLGLRDTVRDKRYSLLEPPLIFIAISLEIEVETPLYTGSRFGVSFSPLLPAPFFTP